MRVSPQSSQRSTWPPSTAVRQASIAAMTRRCPTVRLAGLIGAISGTVAAEDVRHLERGTHAGRSTRRHHHQAEAIERAGRVGDQRCRDLSIAGGRREPGMAEQHLDDADVGAGFEQMRGEAVPQGVHRHRLAQLGASCRDPAGLLQRGDADRLARLPAGKQPTGPAAPSASRRAGSAAAAAIA